MNAVVVRNPSASDPVPEVTRADGSRYRFEMIFENGHSRAYADTAADLIDALRPGYLDLDEAAQLTERVRLSTDLLAPMQAQVLAGRALSDLPERDREVLLRARHEPVVIEEWSSKIPLVLLDVHYAPYSQIPAPISTVADVTDPPNIVWLRPSDEYDFLLSLARAGLISLAESTDFTL